MMRQQTKPLLIKGGRIIDPSHDMDIIGNLLISGSIISFIGKGKVLSDCYVLDAKGLVVCPGFIDLHCHLREPGFENKETIATGARAAAIGGFTTVCCMPNTSPPLDTADTINAVKSKIDTEALIRVLPIGCISKGRKGTELADMDSLADAGVVAFSDDGDSAGEDVIRQALQASVNLGLPVIEHCEDKDAVAGGVMNDGAVSQKLGLAGMSAAAEEITIIRDIALAQSTGGKLHIAHVSTEGSVGIIRRAKADGIKVTAEVTPHHLTLTEDEVVTHGSLAKVNPPLRTQRDIDALIAGLKDNTIDIIATDHAPHTEADKGTDFTKAAFGITGLETALGSLMTLVHRKQISLPVLIDKLTAAPAKIIGYKFGRLGTLTVGAPADITVFDPNQEWTVDPSQFASKGKNTPLAGAKLKGKVVATIYQGKIAYGDTSMKLGING